MVSFIIMASEARMRYETAVRIKKPHEHIWPEDVLASVDVVKKVPTRGHNLPDGAAFVAVTVICG